MVVMRDVNSSYKMANSQGHDRNFVSSSTIPRPWNKRVRVREREREEIKKES